MTNVEHSEVPIVDIQRILCPVDFSETARHALEHAVAIAKWYESRLTALHVISPPLLPQPPILFAEAAASDALMDGDRRIWEDRLTEWLEPARQAGVQAEPLVDEGNPASCILEHAASLPSDLLVMGSHGLSGFERLLLGSVTEKVLRKASCPVLTVPPAAVMAATVPYTRLLCPIDFSESSLAALHFAFSIAEEADAHLTMLHVLDWPSDDELLVEQIDTPELRQVVEQSAQRRLDALLTEDVRVWCKPATRLRYGKPYRQILEVAEQEGTDLIVIGVRGRSAGNLVLFGSTTNHVVRQAGCPVLTLKR